MYDGVHLSELKMGVMNLMVVSLGPMTDWFEQLPSFWKVLIATTVVFSAGASTATFFNRQMALPAQMVEVQTINRRQSDSLYIQSMQIARQQVMIDSIARTTRVLVSLVDSTSRNTRRLACIASAQIDGRPIGDCVTGRSE